jgi:DNA-binding protein H-NS
MGKTYAQIQEQIANLQQKADAARQKEIAGVVKRMNVAIRHYGIKPADLDFTSSTKKSIVTKREGQRERVPQVDAQRRVSKGRAQVP